MDLIAHQSLSTSAGIPVIVECAIYLVPYKDDVMQVYAAPVCFIFDLVAINSFTREAVVSGLKEVLESNSIIKVMHDCSKPAAAIFYQLHIRLCNVFDTQVAMG